MEKPLPKPFLSKYDYLTLENTFSIVTKYLVYAEAHTATVKLC